jgi:predicted transcriptional regulator
MKINGKRLEALRQAKMLSVGELSRMTSIATSTIRNLETRDETEVRFSTIRKLVEVLGDGIVVKVGN